MDAEQADNTESEAAAASFSSESETSTDSMEAVVVSHTSHYF